MSIQGIPKMFLSPFIGDESKEDIKNPIVAVPKRPGSTWEQRFTIGDLTSRVSLPSAIKNTGEIEPHYYKPRSSRYPTCSEEYRALVSGLRSAWMAKTDLTSNENKAMQILAFLEEGSIPSQRKANELLLAMQHEEQSIKKFANVFYSGEHDDFTITVLTTVLWKHLEKLDPQTIQHLQDNLLLLEGDAFCISCPNTVGLIRETENHILMKQGSAYLKNRFLYKVCGMREPKYDNIENELEGKLLFFLDVLLKAGCHEFNSKPYAAYTIRALANLEAFGSSAIREKAKDVLDLIFYSAAVGSLNLRSYSPLRRLVTKDDQHYLYDYRSVFLATWAGKTLPIKGQDKHALTASYINYRPSQEVMHLAVKKTWSSASLYRLGHGEKASCEIYFSGVTPEGNSYLLSAGGVGDSTFGVDVFSRLTCLMVDNLGSPKAEKITDLIYLGNAPADEENENRAIQEVLKSAQSVNNTGVYENFACGACPVHIPKGMEPVARCEEWSLYSPTDGLYVAVYSTDKLGVLALFNTGFLDPEEEEHLIESVQLLNSRSDLRKSFISPSFKECEHKVLCYDVEASFSEWVMISDNERPLHREFDHWPLITKTQGNICDRPSAQPVSLFWKLFKMFR